MLLICNTCAHGMTDPRTCSCAQPKLVNHFRQCSGSSFTCIDCSRIFTRATVNTHTTCVTEHEKYALCATKPGGFAEKGFHNDGAAAGGPAKNNDGEAVGLEFLSTRPPWKCRWATAGTGLHMTV
jgi:cell growth-regulating nucleolar protein